MGRTVNVQDNQGTSVEAFYKSFEDATAVGARVSYRYNDDIIAFADYRQSETDLDDEGLTGSVDATAYGGGVFYLQPDLIDGYDAAIKVSYHTADSSNDSLSLNAGGVAVTGLKTDADATELTAELIISSQETLTESGVKWYVGAGAHQLKSKGSVTLPGGGPIIVNGQTLPSDFDDSSTEFGFSAGLVYPLSFGQAYAAYENIDGSIFGGGIRYYLK